jgi:hypothetical protein
MFVTLPTAKHFAWILRFLIFQKEIMSSLSIKFKNLYLIIASLLVLVFLNYWVDAFQTNFNYINTEVDKAMVDFNVYYSSGKSLRSGEYIYGSQVADNGHKLATLNYPPTFFPFYALFSFMDYETARRVFLLFNLFIFGLTLLLLMKFSPYEERIPSMLTGIGLALLSAPLLSMIFYGQIALIVGCASFASLLFYLNQQKNLSAILLAIAVLIKVNPIFLLATFVLFFNDWKYLIRFSLAMVVIILISLLFVTPDLYWTYITKILPSVASAPPTSYLNQTPLRWLANNDIPFFPNADKTLIVRIYSLVGTLFLAGFAWWTGKRNRDIVAEIRKGTKNPNVLFVAYTFFLLNISVALLVGAKTWSHTYVWYIIPLVPVVLYAIQKTRWWFVTLIGAAVFGVTSLIFCQDNVLNYLNILGACFCAISGFVVLVFPNLVIAAPENVTQELQ